MEIVNPLAGSLAQSTTVTRQQSTDKSRQIRHAQDLRKDVAATPDSFEHQVESTEELNPIHDEQREPDRRRRGNSHEHPRQDDTGPGGEAPPHIDVVA
jgi:hypothetical protein